MPDLSGHKFGRWLVLHKDLDRLDHKGIKSYYICQCDCGSIHSVSAYGLRNGTSKSCGCKTKDRITKVSIRPRACFFPLFSFLPLWLHYNLNPLCVQY